MRSRALAMIAIGLLCIGTPALGMVYQASLGPMPLDDETKAVIAGRGTATAEFQGGTLTVKGTFHGLPSPATEAHVFESPAIGVPGKPVLDLAVTQATEGTVSGRFKLDAAAVRAFRTGNFYIQIDSEKAPATYPWGPKGTLWGWLLPEHRIVGQDVPQEGHWFLPQYDTPRD